MALVRTVGRREVLAALASAAIAERAGANPIPDALKTPHKLGRFVIPPGPAGEFDAKGADVPFAFRHEGRFWMTYVGFDGTGYQTGLASSPDLLEWKREGMILKRDPSSEITRYNVALSWILRENGLFSPGRLRKVQGRYVGVYHAYPKPGYEVGPAVIGLCWTKNLRDWQLDRPFLRAEDGAEWERGGLYKACLLEHNGLYYMLYNAKNQARRWKEQTGVVMSKDLKQWQRFEGNPILRNGGPGAPDEIFASDPCVLRHRNQWLIFYFGLDTRGVARDLLAVSPDLKSTEKCDAPLIDVGAPGSIDSQYAHKPSMIAHRGRLYHFYCAVSKDQGRGISVACSHPFRGS
ncbi:MAG TPA: hypothetical protein DEH78_29245 [Solibacterales bacterium]|nr:hypothetical protein [Bryobacterales bacterium]